MGYDSTRTVYTFFQQAPLTYEIFQANPFHAILLSNAFNILHQDQYQPNLTKIVVKGWAFTFDKSRSINQMRTASSRPWPSYFEQERTFVGHFVGKYAHNSYARILFTTFLHF